MADNLEGFAAQVGGDVGDIRDRTAPIHERNEEFAITDQEGSVALGVTSDGAVMVGATEYRSETEGFRIVDRDDRMAFEVTAEGRTRIYDGAGGGGTNPVTTLHVFLAVGQSNMSGRGDPLSPEMDTTDSRIMQYGHAQRTLEAATIPLDMVDAPFGLSPATTFAREYLATQPPHIGVLLIPAAKGGTGFTYAESTDGWTWSNGKTTDPTKDLYPLSVAQAQEGITAATDAGYSVELRGVLWHQGEANGGGATEWYAGCLDKLIADYRTDLGEPDLPFVAGQMLPEGMAENPSKYTVDKAHVATPARVLRTGFAPAMANSGRYDDYAHFSRVGVEAFGPAYLEAYKRALLNTSGSRPLRPFNVDAHRAGDAVTFTWDAPPCRVTGYRVEIQADGGTWQAVQRDWPMCTRETITAAAPVLVRVVAEHDALESSPTSPIGA